MTQNRIIQIFHSMFISDELEMEELRVIFEAIMSKYNVHLIDASELDEYEINDLTMHQDDMISFFLDKINTKAHTDFNIFKTDCLRYLNFEPVAFPQLPDLCKSFETFKLIVC